MHANSYVIPGHNMYGFLCFYLSFSPILLYTMGIYTITTTTPLYLPCKQRKANSTSRCFRKEFSSVNCGLKFITATDSHREGRSYVCLGRLLKGFPKSDQPPATAIAQQVQPCLLGFSGCLRSMVEVRLRSEGAQHILQLQSPHQRRDTGIN